MPLGKPKPICLGCSYEIDTALGRKAVCPECGREYDLDVRESYGPKAEEVPRADWRQTVFLIVVECVLGFVVLALLGLAPVESLVIGMLLGLGAFVECRRVWRSTCVVLVALHLAATVAIALISPRGFEVAMLYAIFAPLPLWLVISFGGVIARSANDARVAKDAKGPGAGPVA